MSSLQEEQKDLKQADSAEDPKREEAKEEKTALKDTRSEEGAAADTTIGGSKTPVKDTVEDRDGAATPADKNKGIEQKMGEDAKEDAPKKENDDAKEEEPKKEEDVKETEPKKGENVKETGEDLEEKEHKDAEENDDADKPSPSTEKDVKETEPTKGEDEKEKKETGEDVKEKERNEDQKADDADKPSPSEGVAVCIATTRPRRKAAPKSSPKAAPKASPKASPKAVTGKTAPKTAPKRKRAAAPANKKEDNPSDTKPPPKKAKVNPDGTKVDGRSKNKGAAKRESYSVAFKAKMVRDFDAWEAEQIKNGNKTPSVREFVITKKLGHKYENFLSKSSGWRSPKMRARILQDSNVTEYQHMARMPDRSKNKSYYAEMEEALLMRLEDYRKRNLTVTTKTIRDLAREELRRLTNNDEEKVSAFKASNGWVYNFLKRQERKAKEEAMKQKRDKANLKKQQQKDEEEKEGEEKEREQPEPKAKDKGGTDEEQEVSDKDRNIDEEPTASSKGEGEGDKMTTNQDGGGEATQGKADQEKAKAKEDQETAKANEDKEKASSSIAV